MAAEQVDEQTILVADYASLEVGILGDLCQRLFGDGQILGMYEAQKKGVDIHSVTAKEVFGKWLKWRVPAYVTVDKKQILCPYAGKRVDEIPTEEFKADVYGSILRDAIKEIRYGLAYGKSPWGFSTMIGADGQMIGETVAGQMVNALLDAEPGQREWMKWVAKFVFRHHGIYSLGGRWCDLSREMESGDEWQEKRAVRRALNFPCQATGAEIIGDAMIRVSACPELRALGFRVMLQVHDEIVMRGPLKNAVRAKELLVGHMMAATANGTRLLVPLQVSAEYGPNYCETKKFK